MPVFTVIISRVMLGECQSRRVYLSLLPIIVGVFVASATELQFNLVGLSCSLISTCLFAGLNVLAKKVSLYSNWTLTKTLFLKMFLLKFDPLNSFRIGIIA